MPGGFDHARAISTGGRLAARRKLDVLPRAQGHVDDRSTLCQSSSAAGGARPLEPHLMNFGAYLVITLPGAFFADCLPTRGPARDRASRYV